MNHNTIVKFVNSFYCLLSLEYNDYVHLQGMANHIYNAGYYMINQYSAVAWQYFS